MVSTKCSKICQRDLLPTLSAVKLKMLSKNLSKIFIVYTKCSKNCQRYLLSQLSAVKTVKDIYCLH